MSSQQGQEHTGSGSGESMEELKEALAYYKQQTDKLSAENIKSDAQLTKIQNELKQRKEALHLLVELQGSVSGSKDLTDFLQRILPAVASSMKLDVCALFELHQSEGKLSLLEGAGFNGEATQQQFGEYSESFFGEPVLVNKSSEVTGFVEELKSFFGVKFFIVVPETPDIAAPFVIVIGRQKEIPPFYPAFNEVDIHTVQSIGSFIQANMDLFKLHEQTLQQEQEKQELIRQQKDKLEQLVEERTKQLSDRNEELEQANEEIELQRDSLIETNQRLENTLQELRSTQEKLIQKEKMASLGQLTAGIAHEIKNPLNFVTNFSELSGDLADEMKGKLEKVKDHFEQDDYDNLTDILEDLQSNIKRIGEHGGRADSIVKGMLQHSRGEGGDPEETDINHLVSEYADLAYHGLRANNSTFNAEITKDFDEEVGSLEVVPQDLSRAILNIINNGLQAGWDHSQSENGPERAEVAVSTKKEKQGVSIVIRDNGPGISEEKQEKIFEPFYTTKETGEGTGLGLSMAFDVIRAHDGELEVDSEPGNYTEFKIYLPKS